jgi:hypothetical protein
MIMTRRRVLTAAGCLTGAGIVAGLMRSRAGGFKSTITTLFWVGEPSDSDNGFIPNDVSYWDHQWQLSFGGVDDPEHRNGYWPADFKPRENPFYVALPFGEFESESGYELRLDARDIPWYRPGLSPLLKNHWVEINRRDRTCYAQCEDVGPFEVDDFAFVFGNAKRPRNAFDAKAGLDVSPAVWHFLGMDDNGSTSWRSVEAADVPAGPWTEIVTTSGNNRFVSSDQS